MMICGCRCSEDTFLGQTLPLHHTQSQFRVIRDELEAFILLLNWLKALIKNASIFSVKIWSGSLKRFRFCSSGSCEPTGDVPPHPQHILSLSHRFSEQQQQHLPGDPRAQSGKTIRFSCLGQTHCTQRHYHTWGESFSFSNSIQTA